MPALRLFEDEQLDFETRIVLGYAYYRGSEVGEVLSTVDRIKDGDAESWFLFTATASLDGTDDPGRLVPAWRSHRSAWERRASRPRRAPTGTASR